MFFRMLFSGFLAFTSTACSTAPSHPQTGTPLAYDTKGRPATEVLVNDQGPFKFVIDTAAQTVAVGGQLIEDLNLQPDPDNKAQLHGAAGATEVSLYPLKTLEVGGEVFEDLLAPTLAHVPDTDAVGILGMSSFSDARVTFDRKNGMFRVEREALHRPDDGTKRLPIDFIYGTFARVQINVDGIVATAIIDSGAKSSIGNLALMRALDLTQGDGTLKNEDRKEGVTGDEASFVTGYTAEVTLAESSLAPIPLEFSDLHVFSTLQVSEGPALLLGNDVLNQLDLYGIDFKAETFFFTPPAQRSEGHEH